MTPLLALLGKTASDPRGFPIEPLSSVVLSFGASGPLEQITILVPAVSNFLIGNHVSPQEFSSAPASYGLLIRSSLRFTQNDELIRLA